MDALGSFFVGLIVGIMLAGAAIMLILHIDERRAEKNRAELKMKYTEGTNESTST